MAGWIGVDLDGTLAHFDRWRGPRHIGLPIPAMAKRVHDWHERGVEVRIFTARASRPELIPDVQDWLKRHGFPPLAVTNQKDFGMVELWDDRAIQVIYNTGKAVRPNRLEETEKAELFDPDADVVYADEESNEVEPTADEVEKFKRNIKASSDNSLHSLDDLLDALDDGDYAPGVDSKEAGNNSPRLADTAKTLAPPAAKETESNLPLSAQGFVTSTIESDREILPKNAIVEINLEAEDLDLDLDEVDDTTAEFQTMSVDDAGFAPIPSADLKSSDKKKDKNTSTKEQPLKQPLKNQPIVTDSVFDAEHDDPYIDASVDDAHDDLREPIFGFDDLTEQSPSFRVLADDELDDDLHDLPPLKVDRR